MFELPMDPQILCAVVRLTDSAPDWDAARGVVDAVGDQRRRELLTEDLELLGAAIAGQAPGLYNFHAIADDGLWMATRVAAEPEENDAGCFELILRLRDAGAAAAAGLEVTVTAAAGR